MNIFIRINERFFRIILVVTMAVYTSVVYAQNEAPVVAVPIADQLLDEGFVSTTIDLAGVFTDPESDVLTYDAESSDLTVVNVSLTGTILTINEIGLGTAEITVTASDATLSVADFFNVTVNGAPVVAVPIADQLLDEGFVSTTIDLAGVFTDPESDVLTYDAESSDLTVVNVSLTGTILTINEIGLGTAEITVTASDATLSVADFFNVTVNGAPVVAVPIADQLLDEGFVSTTIDLAGVFTDPESDVLTYDAESSDLTVVNVSLTGTILTINEIGLGTAEITVTASDATLSVADFFNVTVNGAPVVAVPIADTIMLDEGFVSTTIDLAGVFTDPESDVLTYDAESSDLTVVNVSLTGTILTIIEIGLGTAEITVTASDATLTALLISLT
jgi:hydrogenase/urease accessory protein HupE